MPIHYPAAVADIRAFIPCNELMLALALAAAFILALPLVKLIFACWCATSIVSALAAAIAFKRKVDSDFRIALLHPFEHYGSSLFMGATLTFLLHNHPTYNFPNLVPFRILCVGTISIYRL